MDDDARQALASMAMPKRPVNFVSAKSGEILKLGHITCRVLEDGSRTGTPQSNILNRRFECFDLEQTIA